MALTGAGIFLLVVGIVIIAVVRAMGKDSRLQEARDVKRELAAYKRFEDEIKTLAIDNADVHGEMCMYINDKLRALNKELEKI